MSYHDWSERDFDWEGLNGAVNYVSDYCKNWGRLGGQAKEKYGGLRFYCHFGHLSLHTLIYPRYVYNQFPKWLWNLDCKVIGPVLRKVFEKPFVKWQAFIYNRAYQGALKRWPHLAAEILCNADYPELIKGAIRIEETEKEIHKVIIDKDGKELGRWVSYKSKFKDEDSKE